MGKKFCLSNLIEMGRKITNCEYVSLYEYKNREFTLIDNKNINDFIIFPLDKKNLKIKAIYTKNITDIFNSSVCLASCIVFPLKMDKKRLGSLIFADTKKTFTTKYFKNIKLISSCIICLLKNSVKKDNMFKKDSDIVLSNMSHEIRTPLNGIIGYNQLMATTQLTDIQKNYMSVINSCCCQLLQIVNDVLDFAKLNAGKSSVSLEIFSIRELINQVEDIIGVNIKNKSQNFNMIIEDNIPPFINSDKNKINQILVNLLNNASKFTEDNGDITLTIKNCKNNFLFFSIKDSGVGISETDQKKLFNVFTQLKNNTIKLGTGLGLAICQKLVKLLEGDIWVISALGKGSNFCFTVKYYEIKYTPEEFIEENKSIVNGLNILLVDDNPNNRVLISEYLFDFSTIPIICASALEAYNIIIAKRYPLSLGLIDICMPGTNGIELAKQIKDKTPQLPLIAISSSKDYIDMSNFECRLEKPIDKLRLLNAIIKVILKYRSRVSFITADTKSQIILLNKRNPIIERPPSPKSDINILIAEDISYSASLLHTMLESFGYKNIEIATDGEQAIEKLCDKNKLFNILFLDLKMPKADGYDVMTHIKHKKYNINIVIVSASVLEQEKNKCVKYGAKYFISKPIQINYLRDVLDQIRLRN